jgi:hypothetical protein
MFSLLLVSLLLQASLCPNGPSFGLENANFRENEPPRLVFIPIRAQKSQYQLVLEEIRFRGDL